MGSSQQLNLESNNTIKANLAPEAYHRMANDFYRCKQSFQSEYKFSPIPYFLLCRAIELCLKARHLAQMTQEEIKSNFGHNILKLYEELKVSLLSPYEVEILTQASRIYDVKKHHEMEGDYKVTYAGKGFEYYDPQHTYRGYNKFPNLEYLDAIAQKLISDFASEL